MKTLTWSISKTKTNGDNNTGVESLNPSDGARINESVLEIKGKTRL